MVLKKHVEGYEKFCELMKNFKSNGLPIFVYFSGSKLPSGESWCSDCIQAWPIVEKELKTMPIDAHFIYVEVGDRATWKDPNCAFRKDPRTKLMVIPTLLRWEGPQKLEGEQCEKAELVSMLFEDEDDD